MPAGLEVYNEDKFLQITESFQNLELKAKGTFNLERGDYASPNKPGSFVAVNYRGETPIFAFTCVSGSCYISLGQDINNFTYYISNVSNERAQGEYFIFDKGGPQGNLGFQLFADNSSLIYDATKKYMRVLDYFESTPEENKPVSRRYAGKRPALVMVDYATAYQIVPAPNDPSGQYFRMQWSLVTGGFASGETVTTNTWRTQMQTYENTGGAMGYWAQGPAQWMVLDVNGY